MLGAGASDRILNGLTRSTSKYEFSDFGSRLPPCPPPPFILDQAPPHLGGMLSELRIVIAGVKKGRVTRD